MCPGCRSKELGWKKVSGLGTVYSYTVTHQAIHPSLRGRVPWTVIMVDLDEGVRMISHIVDCPAEERANRDAGGGGLRRGRGRRHPPLTSARLPIREPFSPRSLRPHEGTSELLYEGAPLQLTPYQSPDIFDP